MEIKKNTTALIDHIEDILHFYNDVTVKEVQNTTLNIYKALNSTMDTLLMLSIDSIDIIDIERTLMEVS